MGRIQDISETLYEGFRPYVPKAKREKYDSEFLSKKVYTSKFVLRFFPKYVNAKTWMKKPKQRKDIYLFNYFFIEVPESGLVRSDLLRKYYCDNHKPPRGVRFTKDIS